jgi:hypothetical protein
MVQTPCRLIMLHAGLAEGWWRRADVAAVGPGPGGPSRSPLWVLHRVARRSWIAIGENANRIKVSIELIGHARKEICHDLFSRAVRIELSSVDRNVMKDNSRDITLWLRPL